MNPFEMLKNAGQIKEQAKKLQDEIKQIVVEGSSGGRMVTVKMNGGFEVLEVHLDPICVDNRDIKMLEDLIVAANKDALSKVQEEIKNRSSALMGGMDLSALGL